VHLNDYARNVYSQAGEDGILAELVARINPPHWCVEFGAGDGQRLSNTAALLERGWRGVMIEGDPLLAERCRELWAKTDRVTVLESVVGWGHADRLDAILAPLNMPHDIGVLSIDVDGNDWHIWEAVRTTRPRIVVVEVNPTLPPFASYVQPRDPAINRGASLLAMEQLGRVKGYELAAATWLNGIFVTAADFAALGIADNRVQALHWYPDLWTWEGYGYDGSTLRGGRQCGLWRQKDGGYEGRLKQ